MSPSIQLIYWQADAIVVESLQDSYILNLTTSEGDERSNLLAAIDRVLQYYMTPNEIAEWAVTKEQHKRA